MSAAVVPLDPASPAGVAASQHITQVLAEIWVAIRRREQGTQKTPGAFATADSGRA
jgi:hypothetical protein